MSEATKRESDVRIVVISDVHVGAGEIDDFSPELERGLVGFIDCLAADLKPVELVVNGDFFDFATAAPSQGDELEARSKTNVPLCFTQSQSSEKTKAIIASHGPLFDALARFLDLNGHCITILPGNHDADLFWPEVRRLLSDALKARGAAADERFRFLLERQYVIERDGKRFWIEHGHQHDPTNSFFVDGEERWSEASPPILEDKMGHKRLYECPGTLGLVRYINGWRLKGYRSLSYLKPNSKVLIALAGYDGFAEPGRPLLIAWHLAHLLGWDVDWKTALDGNEDIHRACHDVLSKMTSTLSGEEEQAFVAYLGEHGIHIGSSLRNFLDTESTRDEVILGVAEALGGGSESRPARIEQSTLGLMGLLGVETEALEAMAKNLIAHGKADYVLTGHTHEPCVTNNGRFINGGCWIPKLEVESIAAAQRVIFEHGVVPYWLNYIEVERGGVPSLRQHAQGVIHI